MSEPPDASGPAVKDRWWVDTGDKRREQVKPAPVPVGARFYRAAAGFDQDTARARLTDLNLKLLREADPPEGGWGYVQLAETRYAERERARITAQVELPPYARGLVVDCGRSLRLLVTGTPIGQRILDLTLGGNPSFDHWVDGELVRERVFRDLRGALGALRRSIPRCLSPEGIARSEALRAAV